MKVCSTCTRWRSLSEFYPDRRPGRSRDGLHHACKSCEREAARKRARSRHVPKDTSRIVRPASVSGQTQLRDARGRYAEAA